MIRTFQDEAHALEGLSMVAEGGLGLGAPLTGYSADGFRGVTVIWVTGLPFRVRGKVASQNRYVVMSCYVGFWHGLCVVTSF